MSEKLAFVQACLDRKKRIVDICNEFGISEKTGHKQLKRFREEGIEGLEDRSHAGLTHPIGLRLKWQSESSRLLANEGMHLDCM